MCMDQLFAVRQVCEKYLANGKNIFWTLVYLTRIMTRLTDMQMLRVYEIGWKLNESTV